MLIFTGTQWLPEASDYRTTVGGVPQSEFRSVNCPVYDIINICFIFQYATVEKQNEKFIDSVEFIKNYIGLLNEPSSDLGSLGLLSGIVDTNKDGLVYSQES